MLVVAAAIILALLALPRKESPPRDIAGKQPVNTIASTAQTTAAPQSPAPGADRLAGVTVVLLNNGKQFPLEIKADGKSISIPGPSSWPGASGSEQGRFIAAIVDTADVLKANGIDPTRSFSLMVGGTALSAANTFRVTGNNQPPSAQATDGFSEEYLTPRGETGIWRALKFKNIVVSYGQVPSLADVLVSPPTTSSQQATPAQQQAAPTKVVPSRQELAASAHQHVEALGSADPATRANAIRDLTLSGYQRDKDKSDPSMRSILEQGLSDNDPSVRQAALNSLEMWNGSIPFQSLSNIALNDQVPELRMHALDLLASRFDDQAVPILQQASHDPDLRVAQKAGELLKQF
ncbi:MAG: HEAT repeat domain-containing protein [Gammaproteobacteria bacterium]